MRLGDVTIPLWGPLLFVVAAMVFAIVVSALNCGLDDKEQPGDGPDVVWEWHRKQGVIRMTAPANVQVRFGVNQRGERLEGIWTVDAEPYEIQYVGQLKCSLATWGGPCEESHRRLLLLGSGSGAGACSKPSRPRTSGRGS